MSKRNTASDALIKGYLFQIFNQIDRHMFLMNLLPRLVMYVDLVSLMHP